MKKYFLLLGLFGISMFCTGQISCGPQPELIASIEVHSVNNCGSEYTNANPIVISEGLEIGQTYEIKATGGSSTAWSDGHAWFYSLQVTYRSLETNEMVTITVGDGQMYSNAQEAEAANIGQSQITAPLAEAIMYFWKGDSYCPDNSGVIQSELWTAPDSSPGNF